MRFRIRFKVSIVTAILLMVGALTAATMASVWLVGSRAAGETARALFASVAQSTRDGVDREMRLTLGLASLGAAQPVREPVAGDEAYPAVLPFLLAALLEEASLYSVYVGFESGAFLQVIAPRGDRRVLEAQQAPAATRWILRTITAAPDGGRVETWRFLDEALRVIDSRGQTAQTYDPRRRPWYASAMGADTAQLSEVYVYDSLKQPGVTASRRLAGGGGVFGVDVTLGGLGTLVASQTVSPRGGIVLFDEQNRVLAVSDRLGAAPPLATLASLTGPALRAVATAAAQDGGADGGAPAPRETVHDGVPLMLQLDGWRSGTRRLGIAVVAPVEDFAVRIRTMQDQIMMVALGCLALFIPLALVVSGSLARSVRILAEDAGRMRTMNFTGPPAPPSRIAEFHELGETFTMMKGTLASRTRALADAESKLTRLVDLGIAMSAERDSARQLEMVLVGAKELTNADGGTIYAVGEDGMLHFQIMHNDTLGIAMGGSSGNPITYPPVPLWDDEGAPNHRNVVSHAVHAQETVSVPDAYDPTRFDFSGTHALDARSGYRSRSFITVPLKPRGGDVIGALQLINARRPGTDEVVPFSGDTQRFVEALAAQAATAMDNSNLLAVQEALLDSMIQLIAGAIDAKSPYTGGHCERVPELAFMLAEAAGEVTDGPLAAFGFKNEAEWREFRIGAWLHDCGKVITPEYVVDKATKLETNYNRIHEVRTRFEVLLRDAAIERLEAIAAGGDADAALARFEARKAELEDDFAFIAECNIGGEFMAPDRIERLKRIAATTWLRHFDDSLGLSHFEIERHGDRAPLPAVEPLLDDKPRHVIRRGRGNPEDRDLYPGLGFQLKAPEHLYNLGEVYNLSISRGTLTEEERFKINEHIMQTIAMLEAMRFPKHLRRVPEYAGTHHETLTGSGYPRKLTKDQLSVPARIMAIADIFEALTASDRPYKKAKTLSESVKILSFFKKDGHIDPDLFDLFLTSGTYRRYAERFLAPEQIDPVDVGQYVTARA